ncbi:MAG: hypothetical protein ACYC0Q_14480 [Eubacteriales bacterium]
MAEFKQFQPTPALDFTGNWGFIIFLIFILIIFGVGFFGGFV